MFTTKYWYYSIYILITLALFVSGYLLFNHYSIIAGKPPESDLCSVIFGKGCLIAALSKFSVFMKIPVGGWGMIYLVTLLCLIVFSQLLSSISSDEFIQIAFWISFVGILFSLFYIVLMIIVPALFCPFCTIFHALNYLLFFFIKKMSQKTLPGLIKGLTDAFGIVFLAKPLAAEFKKWKLIAFIFPLILGLAVYQWALLQGQNIRIDKLSGYNPLSELEQFESSEVFNIQITPDDPMIGSAEAPVSLIVFSDFQCSVCEMFATNFKYLIEYNKEKLNIRFKYFPLSSECNAITKENMHPLACEAARACEAAKMQGRFWEYHDSLFAQGTLQNEQKLFDLAKTLKLNLDKFNVDYNSEACQNKINSDIQEGIRLKLDGTPTAFLNGRRLTKLSENNINFLTKYLAH